MDTKEKDIKQIEKKKEMEEKEMKEKKMEGEYKRKKEDYNIVCCKRKLLEYCEGGIQPTT